MLKRMVVVILLIVLVATLASCGKPPVEDDELTGLASEFVAKLVEEDYSGAVGYFDANMKEALPENKLEETWEMVLTQLGPYTKEIGKRVEKIEEYDAVFITAQFEKAQVTIRVVFDSEKQVAGLFFE